MSPSHTVNPFARLGVCLGLALAVPGCATMWDDVTSRDFHFKSMFERSDPMMVLQDSKDGDARAKALRALKEPRANGGNDVEQDRLIEILAQAAVNDPQPVVRLADTTMNPESRTLLQVTLDDAAIADSVFSTLMGDDVESRRHFIQQNAKDVRFLDI